MIYMRIYLLGINSFICKNIYVTLKKRNNNEIIYCLNHNDIDLISNAQNEDIIINCCGINRADNENEYDEGNNIFVQNMLKKLNNFPFIVHFSSLLIYGFKNTDLSMLPLYQQYFIKSKMNAESHLQQNYIKEKLVIIRPSNIYGYNCEPYTNNIAVSLIYEKICGIQKITNINKNCIRNFLSISGMVNEIINIIDIKKYGTYNILSNNNVYLDKLLGYIYDGKLPNQINLINDSESIPNLKNENIIGENIIVNENLQEQLTNTQKQMDKYIKLKKMVPYEHLNVLEQPRGNMVEISDLNANRLYTITITSNSIRGNHYHYKQIEHFYINHGKIIFLLSHCDDPNILFMIIGKKYDKIIVNPNIIHTLVNDFPQDLSEIFVLSTQKFINDQIPDTKYINII